jgi:hypothetical protein
MFGYMLVFITPVPEPISLLVNSHERKEGRLQLQDHKLLVLEIVSSIKQDFLRVVLLALCYA